MTITWEEAEQRLAQAAAALNAAGTVSATGPLHVGVDLGTADVVVMVLNERGEPLAAFLEWAEVVRDGVVVDFIGAADIVRRLVAKAEARLGVTLPNAATSFPPGTDQRLSTNILERAGLEVIAVADEPSCVAQLLHLDKAAVVDIGGGTTGTAVVAGGEVVFSDDEPSGGRHIGLAIAGHYGISFEAAEQRKREPERYGILDLARPTLQRICDIVTGHIQGQPVERIVLTGGTCCLPGIAAVFAEELGLPIELPGEPLLLTPLAIASLGLNPTSDG
ncbi:MAG: ethanolamine utilization protein EutJ [Desulfosarcinaceae bacterium]|nr:ethanolamine utilization protein EutJ [Desulfosarcinaceae bacterium]